MDCQKPRLLTTIADEKLSVKKQPLDSNGLIMFACIVSECELETMRQIIKYYLRCASLIPLDSRYRQVKTIHMRHVRKHVLDLTKKTKSVYHAFAGWSAKS